MKNSLKHILLGVACTTTLSTQCGIPQVYEPRQEVYNRCFDAPVGFIDAVITEIDGLRQEGYSKYDALQLSMLSCLQGSGQPNDSLIQLMCGECVGSAVEYIYP